VADTGKPITLRTKRLLIRSNGELHVGSESHPYASPLEIVLHGRSTDDGHHPIFGSKFIGVMATATLEIHGPWKRSWTFLEATVHPGTELRAKKHYLTSFIWSSPFYSILKHISFAKSPFHLRQVPLGLPPWAVVRDFFWHLYIHRFRF